MGVHLTFITNDSASLLLIGRRRLGSSDREGRQGRSDGKSS